VVSEFFSKCVVVVKAGATNTIDLRRKLEEYPPLGEKIVGAVLNQAPIDRRLKYYKYSNYSY
jgi:Mrp family chromosome partitioning ATPase